MASKLDSLVVQAREGGDEIRLCGALVARAAEAVKDRRPDAAIADLGEAAKLHEASGRHLDASHCACQAATVARLGGDLDGAIELAERAAALAGDDAAYRCYALVEHAEVLLLARDPRGAAKWLTEARAVAEDTEADLRIGIAMKHAEALLMVGELDSAEAVWKTVAQEAKDTEALAEVLIRRATLLCEAVPGIAPGAVLRAKGVAIEAGQARQLADVALLEATLAISADELDVAIAAAKKARALALECEGAMVYASAAAIIARLCERKGDRQGAYDSLALGIETLAKLLDDELARATFEPLLSELRDRWGETEFAAVQEFAKQMQ